MFRLLLGVAGMAGLSLASVQSAVDSAFDGRPGTAVVVRADTGKLIASHRLDLAGGTLSKPGSTVKPFVLDALRSRKADDLRLVCRNQLRIGTRDMDCSHLPLDEAVNAHRALVYSCNTWFAEASRRLSADDFRQTLLRAGFASPSGLTALEASGVVDRAGNDDEKRLQALGEWGVRVTPLELAAAYRKLALRASGTPLLDDLKSAAQVGTAQLATPLAGSVAAKTGTTSEGAWLAGWMPAKKPEFVVVVYLPAGSGGSDAAPVARAIFASLMNADPLGVKVSLANRIISLSLEEYVAGVVAGEAGVIGPAGAREAVAVAARTWAAAQRGRHKSEGHDFCSTTHCQNYRPRAITAASIAAVRKTAGELLWFEGHPALSYYSRSCGGITEDASRVWPDVRVSYLKQQADPWCRSQGTGQWQTSIDKGQAALALVREGFTTAKKIGTIAVQSRTPSGRVEKLSLGGIVMSGSTFRFALGRQLGWNTVPSTRFEVTDAGDRFTLRGTGSGHGVGLCQEGASRMAQQGRGYADILAFYYPGTILSRSAKGLPWNQLDSERIRMFTTSAARDAALLGTADRLSVQVERRTGLHFHSRTDLRVYPDLATFRDGTGEPGWVAGSTRGKEIRVYRATANAVLRHELMHALTIQNAAPGLPAWFREGIVLYLDNPSKPPGSSRAGDAVPVDREQTGEFYEAARSRVKRMADEKGEAAVFRYLTKGSL